MIVAVSLLMISIAVGQFKLCINGLADQSKLLLVTILASILQLLKGLQSGHPTVPPYGTAISKIPGTNSMWKRMWSMVFPWFTRNSHTSHASDIRKEKGKGMGSMGYFLNSIFRAWKSKESMGTACGKY